MTNITNDIRYVGVNDREIDLFEGQYMVENGMAYNSYVILDEKTAVFDTVAENFTHQWLDNIGEALGDREPDYLVIQHMEPDHSANIANFLKVYPNTALVGNAKTFKMMDQFFSFGDKVKRITVENNGTLDLGSHKLTFVFAPMVHWPEVMVTYDSTDKVLFSADAFGKFGALDAEEDWACEARRYYFGIVGKYGPQVQALLKIAAGLEIEKICPLHGPVLTEDLDHYLGLYDKWSSYTPEEEGIMIAYTSVYGHTKEAVELLAEKLSANGCPKVVVNDLAREDMAEVLEDAFRYSKMVLATTTYNSEIFPFMRTFIDSLTERNFQKRTVAFMENGTWAPSAVRGMKKLLADSKDLTYIDTDVTILSSLNDDSRAAIDRMADELTVDYRAQSGEKADKNDLKALFKIGYGLYVITTNDGKKDNGMICNTVTQLTSDPNRVAVNINKANYSYHTIRQTGMLNVNCLSVEAPFSVFERFGFQSGRTTDKFKDLTPLRSDNGLAFLPSYINAFMSLKVEQEIDLGTHGMFICSVTEARVMSDKDTMTYTYYQKEVKPKPATEGKKGWVCKVCGYIYEGEKLPEDFICPLCKHPASDFEPIK